MIVSANVGCFPVEWIDYERPRYGGQSQRDPHLPQLPPKKAENQAFEDMPLPSRLSLREAGEIPPGSHWQLLGQAHQGRSFAKEQHHQSRLKVHEASNSGYRSVQDTTTPFLPARKSACARPVRPSSALEIAREHGACHGKAHCRR